MFFHNFFLPRRVWTHCIPYAFQFQVIFKIRFFTIDTASYTSFRLHKRFFRFSSPPASKYLDENLAVTSSSQFRYIFQYFHIFFVVCFSTYYYVRFISRFPSTLQTQCFLAWRFSVLSGSLHFRYFKYFPWYFVSKIWSNDL